MQAFIDFFNLHGYIIELVFSIALFAVHFPRRRGFIWRAAGSFLFLCGVSAFWAYAVGDRSVIFVGLEVVPVIKFVLYFALSVAIIFLCFERSFSVCLFTGIAAYSAQHGSYKLGELISRSITQVIPEFWGSAIYFVIIAAAYVAIFFLFRRSFKNIEKDYIPGRQAVLLAVPLVLYTTIFQYSPTLDFSLYVVYALYDILCCFFTLYIQYSLIKAGRREHEYRLIQHLHHIEKEQYDITKKNMEMFDIKMHDIKHMLLGMRNTLSPEQIAEIEKVVTVYDSTVKSGNEVLDVIFTEKSLQCEQKGISFEKIVDGSLLRFMQVSDVYSLFGNAIDNAIEAVSRVDKCEKRVVSLMVRESRGMVYIGLENGYSGTLQFEDGLPVTTKKDKRFHGFGTKSIRNVVEKYGGTMVINASGNIFRLNILLPVPKARV